MVVHKEGKIRKGSKRKKDLSRLNTFYKIASALVATKMIEFVNEAKLYPIEQ